MIKPAAVVVTTTTAVATPIVSEELAGTVGGHCGQDSPLRAAGCEIGFHAREIYDAVVDFFS